MNEKEARPLDIFLPSTKFVSDSVQDYRYSICRTCDQFRKTTRQCRQCGCFMNIKTTMAHAECPLGKWGPLVSD